MTRMTERHRLMANLGLAVASAALAVPAALAHGGYGPGYSASYGPGECGARPGMRQGMEPGYGPGGGGVGLLTEEERAAHRAKMQSLASYDECKMYMTDFNKQIHARAKEKGQTVVGPNDAMCDRMKAHGRFTQ